MANHKPEKGMELFLLELRWHFGAASGVQDIGHKIANCCNVFHERRQMDEDVKSFDLSTRAIRFLDHSLTPQMQCIAMVNVDMMTDVR